MDSIALVPRRRPDLDQGFPDYHIYAGEQLVGRIYQKNYVLWFWGVTTVMLDSTVGTVLHGFAATHDEAKQRLRTAFDAWLSWAQAMPESDLKHSQIDKNLKAIGVR